MSTIAILGTGAMGSRMAQRLLDAGHTVHVWNRTAAATQALAAKGAQSFPTPREAAAGVDIAIAMLRDDEASRTVWLAPETGAALSLKPGCVAVESSTLTPHFVRELAREIEETGASFVDAPVSGSLPAVESGQLVFLAGGDAAVIDKLRPLFAAMGKSVQHAGPHGAGATMKLAINSLLGIQLAATAETLGALKRNGIDPMHALDILNSTIVMSTIASNSAKTMIEGSQKVMFAIDLLKKDFDYSLATNAEASAPTPMIAAAHDVLTEASIRGLGSKNITAVAELYL